MFYPRTISDTRTESQCIYRKILLDEAQPKYQLNEGGGCTYASKRQVNIKSSIGREKISQLYKQEDRKSVENFVREDDIVASMEDSQREDKRQHIK